LLSTFPHPPPATLFPYTTLFRSARHGPRGALRRAPDRLHESGSRGVRRGGTVPGGPVLLAERDPDRAAAVASARGRHPAPRAALPRPPCPACGEVGDGHGIRSGSAAPLLSVAGERSRAAELHRAGGRVSP